MYLCAEISATDNRVSEDCLYGRKDRNECCEGVPDAWYAHLRNPEDCGSFFQCESGKPTFKDCAADLHWSVVLDKCEWPNLAGCDASPPSSNDTTSAPTTKAPSTNAPTNAPTEAPPSSGSPPLPPPTPGSDECGPEPVCHQCLRGIFPPDLCCRDVKTYFKLQLANAEDCNSYYVCVDNHEVLRQCPKGLHWSVDADRCEFPEDAKCEKIAA